MKYKVTFFDIESFSQLKKYLKNFYAKTLDNNICLEASLIKSACMQNGMSIYEYIEKFGLEYDGKDTVFIPAGKTIFISEEDQQGTYTICVNGCEPLIKEIFGLGDFTIELDFNDNLTANDWFNIGKICEKENVTLEPLEGN